MASKGGTGDSTEIRRLIMEEVTRQLTPTFKLFESFNDTLKNLHEWQLGFWSNGSGKPPGYFQMRIKADDERYKKLEDETKGQTSTLDELHDFIVKQTARAKAREEAEVKATKRRRFWLLKIILPIVVTLLSGLGYAIKQAAPVVKILIDDYLKSHPYVRSQLEKQKMSSVTAEPVVSYERESEPEQSAHIPVLR